MAQLRNAILASSLVLIVAFIDTRGKGTKEFQPSSNGPTESINKESTSHDAYINSWAVKIRGGRQDADAVARSYGFQNLGLVGWSVSSPGDLYVLSIIRRFRVLTTCITLDWVCERAKTLGPRHTSQT